LNGETRSDISRPLDRPQKQPGPSIVQTKAPCCGGQIHPNCVRKSL
jgi:hypothetical protein